MRKEQLNDLESQKRELELKLLDFEKPTSSDRASLIRGIDAHRKTTRLELHSLIKSSMAMQLFKPKKPETVGAGPADSESKPSGLGGEGPGRLYRPVR